MKKVLSIALAMIMVLALSVCVCATPVDTANTFAGTTVTGSNDEQIGINFPEGCEYAIGEKVTVHFVGSSDGDFRVWLANGITTMSPEPLFKASENGFTSGDFDFTIELEVGDKDGTGQTIANGIIFKGPSYGTPLSNFTLTSVEIVDGKDAAPAADAPAADAPADEAPAADAPAADAPAADAAPADTGIVLAVLPMAIAAAAVVVSKRK